MDETDSLWKQAQGLEIRLLWLHLLPPAHAAGSAPPPHMRKLGADAMADL